MVCIMKSYENTKVWEIMSPQVTSVLPNTPAQDLVAFFQTQSYHHLPVINTEGNVLGIVSSQDLIRMERLASNRPVTMPPLTARQIMTKHPMFIAPDDTLSLALDIFLENKFHALPVLENEHLVGILTTHDILAFSVKLPVIESD